jgi:hypothetical protein
MADMGEGQRYVLVKYLVQWPVEELEVLHVHALGIDHRSVDVDPVRRVMVRVQLFDDGAKALLRTTR